MARIYGIRNCSSDDRKPAVPGSSRQEARRSLSAEGVPARWSKAPRGGQALLRGFLHAFWTAIGGAGWQTGREPVPRHHLGVVDPCLAGGAHHGAVSRLPWVLAAVWSRYQPDTIPTYDPAEAVSIGSRLWHRASGRSGGGWMAQHPSTNGLAAYLEFAMLQFAAYKGSLRVALQ